MFSEIIKVTQLQNVLIKETVHFGFQNFFLLFLVVAEIKEEYVRQCLN